MEMMAADIAPERSPLILVSRFPIFINPLMSCSKMHQMRIG
jgi:hypothetical protein